MLSRQLRKYSILSTAALLCQYRSSSGSASTTANLSYEIKSRKPYVKSGRYKGYSSRRSEEGKRRQREANRLYRLKLAKNKIPRKRCSKISENRDVYLVGSQYCRLAKDPKMEMELQADRDEPPVVTKLVPNGNRYTASQLTELSRQYLQEYGTAPLRLSPRRHRRDMRDWLNPEKAQDSMKRAFDLLDWRSVARLQPLFNNEKEQVIVRSWNRQPLHLAKVPVTFQKQYYDFLPEKDVAWIVHHCTQRPNNHLCNWKLFLRFARDFYYRNYKTKKSKANYSKEAFLDRVEESWARLSERKKKILAKFHTKVDHRRRDWRNAARLDKTRN